MKPLIPLCLVLAFAALSCVAAGDVVTPPGNTPAAPDTRSTPSPPPRAETITTADLPALQAEYTCDGPYATVTFSWLLLQGEGTQGELWLDLTASRTFDEGAPTAAGPLAEDAQSYAWEGVVANVTHLYRLRTRGTDGWLAGPTATVYPRCDYLAEVPCGDILVPLNKQHRLAADCVPPDLVALSPDLAMGEESLREEAAGAFRAMLEAAEAEGHLLTAASSYRSYATQESLFASYSQRSGAEQANRFSARPGHSEHQLGTTVDVTSASVGFGLSRNLAQTPEGQWLADNAWRYGFVISYPDGFEEITGYMFEPWHVRYVGEDVAREVRETGLTLTEALLLRWY